VHAPITSIHAADLRPLPADGTNGNAPNGKSNGSNGSEEDHAPAAI
jgi:hypothetical protein